MCVCEDIAVEMTCGRLEIQAAEVEKRQEGLGQQMLCSLTVVSLALLKQFTQITLSHSIHRNLL